MSVDFAANVIQRLFQFILSLIFPSVSLKTVALDLIDAASEPAVGSVKAKQGMCSFSKLRKKFIFLLFCPVMKK